MPSRKISIAGGTIVVNGASEKPVRECSRNLPAINATAVAIKNENTIATPPNLGMAPLWRCRPLGGAESHPLRTETSRTNLVRTKERSSDPANVPRNNNVNQFPLELRPLRTFINDEGMYFDYNAASCGELFSSRILLRCFRSVYRQQNGWRVSEFAVLDSSRKCGSYRNFVLLDSVRFAC